MSLILDKLGVLVLSGDECYEKKNRIAYITEISNHQN